MYSNKSISIKYRCIIQVPFYFLANCFLFFCSVPAAFIFPILFPDCKDPIESRHRILTMWLELLYIVRVPLYCFTLMVKLTYIHKTIRSQLYQPSMFNFKPPPEKVFMMFLNMFLQGAFVAKRFPAFLTK